MWHATAVDFSNLLLRAGMPPEVVELASEAVASCAICRKHARLPSRPRTKVSLAAHFGDEVEFDIYYLWGKPFALLVDVATRYKVSYAIGSREGPDLLQGLLQNWIRYFGPMRVFTSDQESSLMAPHAAAELERLGITRNPKGATSGEAGKQHTGTGLIERHVALVKLTMLKMKAECDRQGLVIEDNDIAMEASMSHNLCLTYGGYTPCMAVFGVLPRSLYEFEAETVTAIQGALDKDLSVFGTAMRLRQIALVAVQQSISEDRIARANRSRPQKVDTAKMIPGTIQVEVYRDGSWRGPAILLEMNEEEGTSIVKHQGKPYLMPMRYVRPHLGVFFNMQQIPDGGLQPLMKLVEASKHLKPTFLGYQMTLQPRGMTWRLVPLVPSEEQQMVLQQLNDWSRWLQHPIHALQYGQGLPSLHPPRGTRGTILTWLKSTEVYSKMDKLNDDPVQIRKEFRDQWESLCLVYFMYYPVASEEMSSTTPTTSTHQQLQPPAIQPHAPPHLQPSTQLQPEPMEEDDSDDGILPQKRDMPDSRTVVIASEKKKQRLEYYSETSTELQMVQTLQWLNERTRDHRVDATAFWTEMYLIPTWFSGFTMQDVLLTMQDRHEAVKRAANVPLVQLPGRHCQDFFVDLCDGGCFMSLQEENAVREEDLAGIWSQVEEADAKELAQFITEKAFSKIALKDVPEGTVVIDGTWVRCWKIKQGRKS